MSTFTLKRPALGAFSGGGVKVLAYIGAIRACEDLKISFAATAGTSGGAIVAALLAAGATAARIESSLKGMNFLSFLKKPISTSEFLPHLGRSGSSSYLNAAMLKLAKRPDLSKLIRHWGLYSSENIQSWLEKELASLLGKSVGAVQFKDLPLPLYVVAADLISAKVKVWSRESTPESSVAFAVRTSCSIPLFFQPVHHEGSLLVDGGILSNLPVFVFSEHGGDRFQSSSLPILAFRLVSEFDSVDRQHLTTIESLLHVLANTVIDGATNIQTSLLPTIHEVSINVGAVKTTDFSTVTSQLQQDLVERGSRMTATRIEEIFAQAGRPTLLSRRQLPTVDATQLHFVMGLKNARDEAFIVLRTTDRLQKLLPTILEAAHRGVKITLITGRNLGGDRKHAYRCKLFAKIGVTVKLRAWHDGMLQGLLVDPLRSHGRFAVLLGSGTDGVGIDSTTYTEYSDDHIFPLLRRATCDYLPDCQSYLPRQESRLSLHAGNPAELTVRLRRGVSSYSPTHVSISMEDVAIEKVFTVVKFVREYKYEQLAPLMSLYESARVAPFEPLVAQFGSGSTIVTPPVLEEHGGKFVVIEGATRAFWHHITKKPLMKCLLVRGCQEGLPARTRHISEVFLSNAGGVQAFDSRVSNQNPNLYRPIERAIHPLDDYPDADFGTVNP